MKAFGRSHPDEIPNPTPSTSSGHKATRRDIFRQLELDMCDEHHDDDPLQHKKSTATPMQHTKRPSEHTSAKSPVKKGVAVKSSLSSTKTSDNVRIPDKSQNIKMRDSRSEKKNIHAVGFSKKLSVSQSQTNGMSYSVKRDEEILISSDGEPEKQSERQHEDSYKYHKPAKRKAAKDSELLEVLKERSQIMHKMSDTVASISKVAIKPPPEDSAEMLWAKSLVLQMSRMNETVKDQFMVHVYKLAMDAISGKFPSTN